MDDPESIFASQYSYNLDLDIDMMKRSIDPVGGPESKKARWSPTTFTSSPAVPANGAGAGAGTGAGSNTNSPTDVFANYGYGPHAAISHSHFNSSPTTPGGAFGASPLYSTPSLSSSAAANGNGMPGQLSPNPANIFQHQQNQHQPQHQPHSPGGMSDNGYGNFGGYNMLGMGMPGMNMLSAFPYANQMGNFGQNFNQRLPPLNVNISNVANPYSPGGLNAMSFSNGLPSGGSGGGIGHGGATGRTVYVGNLPPTSSVDELLNMVHFGPLESVRVLPEKCCVFLSFLDASTANAFYADSTVRKLQLQGQELKIGWGKPTPVPPQVALAVAQSGASRNVYLGGLEEGILEEQLRDELSRFGLIDQVKIVRDKNIGFVHFLSISVATKVVGTLPFEPAWAGKRVNYGKDRCAYVPKSQQVAAHAAQAAAAQSLVAQTSPVSVSAAAAAAAAAASFLPFSPFGGQFTPADMAAAAAAAAAATGGAGGAQGLNRTVYLGNIHPETTTEDLCNAIRGGVLQSIRYMQDKHIAFITFVDPAAAFNFFQTASYHGLTLNNRRLKVGWGKNGGPLPPTLALAVHAGATRNVYIGNVEDFETFGEERLKRDFGEYGDIELVNFLKEKNCAFVNFTNITNAIKAIEGVKAKPEYANLRIAHGKDRCANPPRASGGSAMNGHGNGHGGNGNGGRRGGGGGISGGTSMNGQMPMSMSMGMSNMGMSNMGMGMGMGMPMTMPMSMSMPMGMSMPLDGEGLVVDVADASAMTTMVTTPVGEMGKLEGVKLELS